jgi:hypothetical protein
MFVMMYTLVVMAVSCNDGDGCDDGVACNDGGGRAGML